MQEDLIGNMEFEEKSENSKERIRFLERTINQLASENQRLRKALKHAEEYKNMYLDKFLERDSDG